LAVEGVVVDDLKHGQCRLAVVLMAKEGVVSGIKFVDGNVANGNEQACLECI